MGRDHVYYAITAQLNGGGDVTCTLTVDRGPAAPPPTAATARGGTTKPGPRSAAASERQWYLWLTPRPAPTTMWWSHADADTCHQWIIHAGLRIESEEFVPKGDSGHQLFWVQRPR